MNFYYHLDYQTQTLVFTLCKCLNIPSNTLENSDNDFTITFYAFRNFITMVNLLAKMRAMEVNLVNQFNCRDVTGIFTPLWLGNPAVLRRS